MKGAKPPDLPVQQPTKSAINLKTAKALTGALEYAPPTAGVGMDYALWNSWSVRLEYDYLDFGSRGFAMNNIATGAFAENATVRLKAHEVKLGLNYLFNAGNFNPIVWPAPSACRRRSIRRRSRPQIGRSAAVRSSARPIPPSVR